MISFVLKVRLLSCFAADRNTFLTGLISVAALRSMNLGVLSTRSGSRFRTASHSGVLRSIVEVNYGKTLIARTKLQGMMT